MNKKSVIGYANLGARQRRDDSLGHRLTDPEWIADGQHDVADFERVGIAQFHHRKALVPLQAHDHEIRALIAQHNPGIEFPLVCERDFHIRHAFDDVIIGDDEA